METRTELILLQRTMVVVEGVARSLDPRINIWEVARPVVEDYIRQSIGPKAVLADLSKTAQVLVRFGPRLPGLVQAALIRQARDREPVRRQSSIPLIFCALLGALGGAALILLLQSLT